MAAQAQWAPEALPAAVQERPAAQVQAPQAVAARTRRAEAVGAHQVTVARGRPAAAAQRVAVAERPAERRVVVRGPRVAAALVLAPAAAQRGAAVAVEAPVERLATAARLRCRGGGRPSAAAHRGRELPRP